MEFLSTIESFILNTAHSLYVSWGWFGVAALLTFENATGITPSEIILGLAGWMLISEQQSSPSMIFLGGTFAAIGSSIGSSITYWVARLGGRPLIDKLSRWLRIDANHIDRAEKQFQRWGSIVVLVGRVMPGIRTLINIPAGLSRFPYINFLVITFVGSYVWCTLLIGAGFLLGNEWTKVSVYLKLAFPYLLAAGSIAMVTHFWVSRQAQAKKRAFLKLE